MAGDRAPRREGEVTPEEQIDDEELELDAMIQPGEGSPSPERETHEEYSSAPGGPLRNPVTWHAYSAPSSSSSSAPPARSRLEGARSEADWRERKHEQPGSPTTPRGFVPSTPASSARSRPKGVRPIADWVDEKYDLMVRAGEAAFFPDYQGINYSHPHSPHQR